MTARVTVRSTGGRLVAVKTAESADEVAHLRA